MADQPSRPRLTLLAYAREYMTDPYEREASAIAAALELLAEFMGDGMPGFAEQSWYDEEGVEGTEIRVFGHGWEQRFHAALEALNRLGAQP